MREGNDIYSTIELTATQAALGATLTIPTLEGDDELELEPGTQPGEIKVLRGRGMPVLQGFGRGDQHVFVNVLVPRHLNEEQRRLLEEFETAHGREDVPKRRGLLREAEERVSLRRYVIIGGEAELALLLHIFPEGVEELDGAFAVYADEPPVGFDVVEAGDVPDGWEDNWRAFHHGVVVGRFWVGPPWEDAPDGRRGDRDRSRAARSAPARTRRRASRSSCSRSSSAAACSTSAAAPACSRSPPRSSGSGRSSGSTSTTLRSRRPLRTREVNGVELTALRADALVDELPPARFAVANVALDVVERLLPRLGAERAVTSGYLDRDEPARRGLAPHRPARSRRLGCGPARTRLAFRAMASFSVRFLGCKVSHVDAHEVRERLLADGHTELDAGADVAIVNTCCVTHEAVSKSRKEAARAARTHRRVYVTGCGANLARTAFAGLPENVVVVARRSEDDAGLRRRRSRRDRLRAGGREARPRPRVREGAGRLLLLLQLLRDPARARIVAQPPRRCRPRGRSRVASSRGTARSC